MPRSKESYSYKEFALQAAKDLLYSEVTIEKIENAKSDAEIERIMIAARKEMAD